MGLDQSQLSRLDGPRVEVVDFLLPIVEVFAVFSLIYSVRFLLAASGRALFIELFFLCKELTVYRLNTDWRSFGYVAKFY